MTCNQPYTLMVDGVTWSPIDTEENADVFLLTTSGRVTIFVDNKIAMSFKNSIELDFELEGRTSVTFMDSGGSVIDPRENAYDTYIQARGRSNARSLFIQLNGDYSSIEDLEASCNQGTLAQPSITSTYYRLTLNDYDPSVYAALYVGNVLVGFIEPA